MIDPLHQFELKTILPVKIYGYDFSLTNSGVIMMMVPLIVIAFFSLSTRQKDFVPSRLRMVTEMLYCFISRMIDVNIGSNGRQFMPLIFSVFLFVSLCNMLGMLPYGFTVTSHVVVTFSLAIIIFLSVTIFGFIRHGTHFLSIFLPHGTPSWLAPFMILIELITYLARPFSLSLRLAANMTAGHVLLKIIASAIVTLSIFLKPLPLPFAVVLTGFEFFVAILQAYIFAILSCIYLHDAVNLH